VIHSPECRQFTGAQIAIYSSLVQSGRSMVTYARLTNYPRNWLGSRAPRIMLNILTRPCPSEHQPYHLQPQELTLLALLTGTLTVLMNVLTPGNRIEKKMFSPTWLLTSIE
jgi:hypothetical protein